MDGHNTRTESPPYRGPLWLPYAAPFAAYMGVILLDNGFNTLATVVPLLSGLAGAAHIWLYPIKIGLTTVLLWHYRHAYTELCDCSSSRRHWLLSIGVGIAVFMLWIRMDWSWAQMGEGAEGYNPFDAEVGHGSVTILIGIRLLGASLVVPIMEELFWRAFIMRYLIHPNFQKVQLGTFTLGSFAITAALFGLEHHLWLAGIMAGAAYGGLLCVTRHLPSAILAHGVTNLLLGVWVLSTGRWSFW